jgi:hypothetical protein
MDVLPSNHVLIEVPVEGVDGDGGTTVRVRADVLEELPRWRVVASRQGSPSAGADATKAWWVDAERDGDRAHVEVRLSGTAASMPEMLLPDETRKGISTHGRSAVEKFAWRFKLPRVIVLGSGGAFELSD